MGDQRTALVLAGGGTKGAFEVGAIAYLVTEAGLVPDVITAASAGSIVASVLAQARTGDELQQRVGEMRADLLTMTDLGLVFGRQPWLADLQDTPIGAAIDTFIEIRPPSPELAGVPPLASPDPTTTDRGHHRRLGLHAVRVALGSIPELYRAWHHLPSHESSFLTLEPLADRLRGIDRSAAPDFAPIDPALVARPGLDFRMAVTELRSGLTRFVTGTGAVVETDAVTPCPDHTEPVDLIEAVLTSSSAPPLFPSRRLGGQDYADGGITQNVPVAAAVALGATDIYAVVAMALYQPPDPTDFSTATMFELLVRSMAIMFADHQRANLAAPRPEGVDLTVIAPTVELVGSFEVNEGLMRIDMDYGHLRAQEVTAGLDPATRARAEALTDRIIVARDHAWFVEEALWRDPTTTTTPDLSELEALKAIVRDTLAERAALGLAAPESSLAWSTGWEVHDGERPARLPAALP